MPGKDRSATNIQLLLGVIAFVAAVTLMRQAQALVVPILLAMFLAAIAAPVVAWLRKRGLPTGASVGLVVVTMVGIVLLFGAVIGTSLKAFTARVPMYRQQMTERYQAIIDQFGERFGLSAQGLLDLLDPGQAMGLAANLLNSVSGALTNVFLILFTMILIMFEMASFPDKLRVAIPSAQEKLDYLSSVGESLEQYMAVKTAVSLLTGTIVTLLVWLVGLDFPVLWGLLAFALNYVPTIGSILAAIPAVLLALVQLGPGEALVVAGGYAAVNVVVGNVIEPRVTGQRMGLSTLVVFLSLLFWGWVLGSIGMLLSVPLTMTFKIALASSPETRWLSILMDSGAPAAGKAKEAS
jgi:predicted PurR-regulated permease PerM